MIRWAKIKAIATFEFLATVKRPGYLITTFGMPLFMGIYVGVVALPAYYAQRKQADLSVWGVVDESSLLALKGDAEPSADRLPETLRQTLDAAGQRGAVARAIASERFIFRPFDDEAAARAAIATRSVKGYFVVPRDYLSTGQVTTFQADDVSLSFSDARRAFERLLRERLIAGLADGRMAARILNPIQANRSFDVTKQERSGKGDARPQPCASSFRSRS